MSKKEQMFALVEQWRESGLTRKSFANQHGFKSESFNYWWGEYNCRTQFFTESFFFFFEVNFKISNEGFRDVF